MLPQITAKLDPQLKSDNPMTLEAFVKKYGTDGPYLLISEFVAQAPDFPGCNELASKIGTMIGDLEFVLANG